jgi:hypothetical protein
MHERGELNEKKNIFIYIEKSNFMCTHLMRKKERDLGNI